MPAHVWNAWREFNAREPFGPRAWDYRIAHVLAVLVHALTGKPQCPTDYVIQWGGSNSEPPDDPPAQDWRQMKAIFTRWAGADDR